MSLGQFDKSSKQLCTDAFRHIGPLPVEIALRNLFHELPIFSIWSWQNKWFSFENMKSVSTRDRDLWVFCQKKNNTVPNQQQNFTYWFRTSPHYTLFCCLLFFRQPKSTYMWNPPSEMTSTGTNKMESTTPPPRVSIISYYFFLKIFFCGV